MIVERAGGGFNRAMRMTRSRDIARVFRDGLSFPNPYVVIRVRRRGGTSAARLAFALARRHVASAVRRNRAKRIVRESFRRHAELLRGYDLVVVSRTGLDGAKGRDLRNVIDLQWPRVVTDLGSGVPRNDSASKHQPMSSDQASRVRHGASGRLPTEHE